MQKMTLIQHFSELRRRFLWTMLVFVCAFVFGWYVAPPLQQMLTEPLLSVWPNGALLYTEITDGLMINLSLALVVALVVVIPVAFWHVWAFVAPGLKKKEKNFIWPILVLSPILFVLGAVFAFYVLFPFVFGFFIDLNQNAPVPSVLLPAMRDYLVFAIGLLKVFGFAFQLPLVMVLLNRIGVLPRTVVAGFRRYAIVIIAVVAAVLTPPDVVSQILLGVPLWALFEISLLFMRD